MGNVVPAGRPAPHRTFRPRAGRAGDGSAWFEAAGARAAHESLTGRAGSLSWALSWKDAAAPLWTFPRVAWERELLPGAQVVLAPTAEFSGSLTVGDTSHPIGG
ncbi:hypothetical protein OSI78_06055 [Mycobacterium ulcerans]